MLNWKIITGCFEGSVIDQDTEILDVPFCDLDEDLKDRIRDYAKESYDLDDEEDFPVTMNELKTEYENSWEVEPTEEPIDLLSLSEW